MTTIAADTTRMVADSMCTDTDQKWFMHKVERIDDVLAATAGSAAEGERFYNWLRKPRTKRPELSTDFSGMVLRADGLWVYDCNLQPIRVEKMHAIGSGAKAARGAYAAGATLDEAVTIACQIDAFSNLPIVSYELVKHVST